MRNFSFYFVLNLDIGPTLDYRIQQTALNEIGINVIYDKEHFITREAIAMDDRPNLDNQLERCHNISMLFFCKLPDDFEPYVSDVKCPVRGDLRWFSSMPTDLLEAHRILYGDIIEGFFKGEKRV